MSDTSTGEQLHKEYWDMTYVSGPLVFLENGDRFPTGAILDVHMASGEQREGQILEATKTHAVLQIPPGHPRRRYQGHLGFPQGLTRPRSPVLRTSSGAVSTAPGVSPSTACPPWFRTRKWRLGGSAINPVSRDAPNDFIETGISTIDGFNTLVRGQKLPIFLGSGLPGNEIANMIVQNSGTKGDDTPLRDGVRSHGYHRP